MDYDISIVSTTTPSRCANHYARLLYIFLKPCTLILQNLFVTAHTHTRTHTTIHARTHISTHAHVQAWARERAPLIARVLEELPALAQASPA